MNVYEKLNLARVKFQSSNVKMSGKNSFSGYSYYELSDILPKVNEICSEVKASCVVSFGNELAKLEFIDSEKPEEKITFTSPMSEATLKGCHAVQNLGAVETYIKRYLYQHCFEIVESDCLDLTMNPKEEEKTTNKTSGTSKNNSSSNKPTEVKKLSPQEEMRYQELCVRIEEYIFAEVLKDDFKRKAEHYINIRDIDGLEKTLAWCQSQGK